MSISLKEVKEQKNYIMMNIKIDGTDKVKIDELKESDLEFMTKGDMLMFTFLLANFLYSQKNKIINYVSKIYRTRPYRY